MQLILYIPYEDSDTPIDRRAGMAAVKWMQHSVKSKSRKVYIDMNPLVSVGVCMNPSDFLHCWGFY